MIINYLYTPPKKKLSDAVDKINEVESTIEFIYETETNNNTLRFLDIMLNFAVADLEIRVYHKSTKYDVINVYSHHKNQI